MRFYELAEQLAATATAYGRGATEAEVVDAESRIGPLPSDFRQFLRKFGWATLGHYEIYGLGHDVPEYLDLARMTLAERQEPSVPLRGTYVCIMNDGGGNLLCFDSDQVRAGTANTVPLLLWDHELDVDQTPEVVAESFTSWLKSRLEEIRYGTNSA
jgi:hypothetical protein